MYGIELVEGKDHPHQMGAKGFDNLGGKTVGPLIRLTRHLWNTGKVVVLDSGSCVAKALTPLAKKGVFGSALIKKHRYWPKDINRDLIKVHFKELVVGNTDCLWMHLLEDNSKLDIHGFKEPNYIMMLMDTYGTIQRVGQEQIWTWKSENAECRTTFQYPELVHNHFKYCHAFDDLNNQRQAPISIERTWPTNRWPHWVFAFLIAITEANVIKVWINLLNNLDIGTLAFSEKLSEELINNPYLFEESAQDACHEHNSAHGIGHKLISLPPNCRNQGTQIVPSDTRYPQRKCTVCQRKCRDYCSCFTRTMIYNCSFSNRLVEMEMKMEMQEAN